MLPDSLMKVENEFQNVELRQWSVDTWKFCWRKWGLRRRSINEDQGRI